MDGRVRSERPNPAALIDGGSVQPLVQPSRSTPAAAASRPPTICAGQRHPSTSA